MADNSSGYGFDVKQLRAALGSFSTGVTIITTLDGDAVPVGVTANSFSSVSLDPPLVLWSLAKTARSYEAYSQASHWAVHILSQEQMHLSNRFAKSGEDKFSGINYKSGCGGSPLLEGVAACFQCETWQQYDGGDHTIFVGRVVEFEKASLPSLVFQEGKYAVATPKIDELSLTMDSLSLADSSLGGDFLGYLLLRSYAQFQNPIRKHLLALGLKEWEFLILIGLFHRSYQSTYSLDTVIADVGYEPNESLYEGLIECGYIERESEKVSLTEKGREIAETLLRASKNVEAAIVEQLGASDASVLKNLLRKFILTTSSDIAPTCEAV